MVQILNQAYNWLLSAQKAILIICSIIIIGGISTQAAFRYVFRIAFFGFEELVVLLAFWLYFIGASYGTYSKSHIQADVIPMYIKNQKIKSGMHLAVSLVTIIIAIIFGIWAIEMFTWTFERSPTTPMLKIPHILYDGVILLGFFLMTFYFLVHFVEDIKSFIKMVGSGKDGGDQGEQERGALL